MASTRQIEQLERKHRENPEGLTFAPLANAYRNSGQPERAIEILMLGLEHHPDHAPARIVLGRCHLDLEDDVAAEEAFAKVLELDKENVVALKALADITERSSRFDDAAQWLGYLLEVDRNNEEAREQLERVNATKAIAEAAGGEQAPEEAWTPTTDEEHEVDEAVVTPETGADEVEPITLDSPWGEATGVSDDLADNAVPEAGEPEPEPPASRWEPPAIAGEVTEGLAPGFEGPGGPPEEEAAIETTDTATPERAGEDDVEVDFAATLEPENNISLTPTTNNEFQIPDAAQDLSLRAEGDNELEVEQDGDSLELHGSVDNEFQRPSDAELLRPSVEEDAGERDASVELTDAGGDAETADSTAGSWFSPAPEETAAPVTPEPQPDGTTEPLEEPAFGSEPPEPPFEESEPLPSTWGPAGDVEEVIRAEAAESSQDEPESVGDGEGVSGLEVAPEAIGDMEVEPGSLLASEMVEEDDLTVEATSGEGTEDDLYPEVLGSDQPEESPVEVEPLAGDEPEPEPAIVATETMAEVYLSQGHRLEALEVYRTLLQSTPGDVRLSEKVSALEQELEGGVVAGGATESDLGGDPVVESGGSYAGSSVGGQTVKEMFRGLLSTRLAAPAPAAPPTEAAPVQEEDSSESGHDVVGEPTRPAQDSLSLSAIFGEDSSPVPPAVGGGGPEVEAGEGFSFDSFFGDEEGGKDPRRPSGGGSKGREDEEDLDQFQSWLQGLKG